MPSLIFFRFVLKLVSKSKSTHTHKKAVCTLCVCVCLSGIKKHTVEEKSRNYSSFISSFQIHLRVVVALCDSTSSHPFAESALSFSTSHFIVVVLFLCLSCFLFNFVFSILLHVMFCVRFFFLLIFFFFSRRKIVARQMFRLLGFCSTACNVYTMCGACVYFLYHVTSCMLLVILLLRFFFYLTWKKMKLYKIRERKKVSERKKKTV